MHSLTRIAVFCGSAEGSNPATIELAKATGTELAHRGLGLVYGGSNRGVMGAVADAALAAGGEVLGVLPRDLFDTELPHHGVDLRWVTTMHERKSEMYDLCDAAIALPGGYGTLEEIFEVATWTQIGLHHKPIALLDTDGFWIELDRFLDTTVASGFVKGANRDLIVRTTSVDDALRSLVDRSGARNQD